MEFKIIDETPHSAKCISLYTLDDEKYFRPIYFEYLVKYVEVKVSSVSTYYEKLPTIEEFDKLMEQEAEFYITFIMDYDNFYTLFNIGRRGGL